MKLQRFVVSFDDGQSIEVELKSRDLAALERDGVDLSATPPMRGSYLLAFAAMSRLARKGLLGVDLPGDVDELMDSADLEPVEADDVGEGSGQVPATG